MDMSVIPTEIRGHGYGVFIEVKHALFDYEKRFKALVDKVNNYKTLTSNLYLLEIVMNLPENTLRAVLNGGGFCCEIATINGLSDCLVFKTMRDRDRFMHTIGDLYVDSGMSKNIRKGEVEVPVVGTTSIISL